MKQNTKNKKHITKYIVTWRRYYERYEQDDFSPCRHFNTLEKAKKLVKSLINEDNEVQIHKISEIHIPSATDITYKTLKIK